MDELIETPRLVLRKPRLADARVIFEQYAQDSVQVRHNHDGVPSAIVPKLIIVRKT